MYEISAIRSKPGKWHAFALCQEWSTQMTAMLGEAWCNKMHFCEFVGCQSIVCSSPRGVRDGQHRDRVTDLGYFTSASKTMLLAVEK